jgi:hypothetical protein
MTDIYDQATDREEKDRALALEHVRRNAAPMLATGVCHYCGSPTRRRMLFCDPVNSEGVKGSCRDDFEKEQARKRRNGN